MAHTIGDKTVLALGKKLSFHAPLRHYYLVRNAIYLYFYSDLAVKWKLSDSVHLIAKFILYSIIDLPSTNHMMHMARGFVDGLTRKMGPRRGAK
jgi:rhamnosyltransferase